MSSHGIQRLMDRAQSVLPATGWPISESFTVAFRCGEGCCDHYQTYCDGELTSWSAGDPDRADLVLNWPVGSLETLWTDFGSLGEADVCGLRFTAGAHDETFGFLPADPATLHVCTELPVFPGANATIAYRITGGLVQSLDLVHSIVDGRLLDAKYGHEDDAQVQITVPWEWGLDYLRGECSLLEVMANGSVVGDLPAMCVTNGVLESEEYVATWQPHREAYDALDQWVELMRSSAAETLRVEMGTARHSG